MLITSSETEHQPVELVVNPDETITFKFTNSNNKEIELRFAFVSVKRTQAAHYFLAFNTDEPEAQYQIVRVTNGWLYAFTPVCGTTPTIDGLTKEDKGQRCRFDSRKAILQSASKAVDRFEQSMVSITPDVEIRAFKSDGYILEPLTR